MKVPGNDKLPSEMLQAARLLVTGINTWGIAARKKYRNIIKVILDRRVQSKIPSVSEGIKHGEGMGLNLGNDGPSQVVSWATELAVASRTNDGVVDPQVLHRFLDGAPRLRVEDPRDLPGAMSRFAAESTSTDGVTLHEFGVGDTGKGMSGAPVYVIRHPDGRPLAIAKIFPQAEELLRELSAADALKPHISIPTMHGVAITKWKGQDAGALVMSLAPGRNLLDMVRDAGAATNTQQREHLVNDLAKSMEHAGTDLGKLHSIPAGSGGPVNSHWLESEISMLKRETTKLTTDHRQLLNSWGVDPDELLHHVDQAAENMRSDPGPAALMHGDPHAGNIFITPEGRVTFIDLSNAHHHMDALGRPRGSPGKDVVDSMTESLRWYAHEARLSDQEIGQLSTRFHNAYRQAGGPEIPAVVQTAHAARVWAFSTWMDAKEWKEASDLDRRHMRVRMAYEITMLKQRLGMT